ncbi:MAG: acetolactate synthase small subunit [Dehalococcoidia bacterium]
MSTKHTVVALVEDHPGVLNRVASLFRRRGFNIDSITVGSTETDGISRMTIVVDAATTQVEQVEKQLYKLIDVVKVSDITNEGIVARELALIKVRCNNLNRHEIVQLAQIFRADVVDVTDTTLVVQAVAEEEQLDSLIQVLKPYGIRELARTGRVALTRGVSSTSVEAEPAPIREFHRREGRMPNRALPYVSD